MLNINVGLRITHSVLRGFASAWFVEWVLGASRLFIHKGVPPMSNNQNRTIMERYTLNLKLPKILCLSTLPSSEEEEDFISRNVFMHSPTGGIVEILSGQGYILDKTHMEHQFCIKEKSGENYKYTALLLNKPKTISPQNGEKALKDVIKWFTKYTTEYNYLDSLEWSPL